jgi:hypothetical protein
MTPTKNNPDYEQRAVIPEPAGFLAENLAAAVAELQAMREHGQSLDMFPRDRRSGPMARAPRYAVRSRVSSRSSRTRGAADSMIIRSPGAQHELPGKQ